jgi:hypothetical protein
MLRKALKEKSATSRAGGTKGFSRGNVRLRSIFILFSLCLSLTLSFVTYADSRELSRAQLAAILLLLKNTEFGSETSDEKTETDEQALQYFSEHLANQVVGSSCINCHVNGGLAQATGLIFVPGDDAANLNAIRSFIEANADDGDLLLTKMSGGQQHGGGMQFGDESSEYRAMRNLIDILYPPPNSIDFYLANVKNDVVDGICLGCHKSDGLASTSQLVFTPGDDEANLEVLRAYMKLRGDEGRTILSKVSGAESHGGGAVLKDDSIEYAALSKLLSILSREDSRSSDVTGEGFFDGVILANAEQTLRRAALIMSSRLPTQEEVSLAKTGEEGLREALMGLMQGEGFHEFLIRSANDRLHTDAFFNGLFPEIADLNGSAGSLYPLGAEKYFLPQPYTQEDYDAREAFLSGYKLGVARAPLELIAYIVENDRPYTEVVTADYTMVNWYSEQVFRSGVAVGSKGDARTFLPASNYGQVVRDENYESEFVQDSGTRVLSHSGFIDYPHAGVLNDLAWLNRYPTTETNRNRARARWTYYHFLGVDIETSAPRTTDPEALADTNNPTLNNPACTVCHNRLDPVAGAYQNFGNEGFFRDAWGGKDALPNSYKHPDHYDGDSESLYQEGDTWFRDMLPPGFNGADQPSDRTDDSLHWLGQQIASDKRFATAAVNFWWPALMGAKVIASPEVASDANYEQLSAAFNAQQRQIQTLADTFEDSGYIARELLADMVMSPWFRAKSVDASTAASREVELASVGIDRLLTPEELDAKNEAILGYLWDKWPNDWIGSKDEFNTALTDRLRLYYGGIDSIGVKDRSSAMTALMANVAERQALHLACAVTTLDFFEHPSPERRRLFNGVSQYTTPLTEVTTTTDVEITDYAGGIEYAVSVPLTAGVRSVKIMFNNDDYNSETEQDRNLYIDKLVIYRDGVMVDTIEAEDFESISGFDQTTYENGDVMGGVHSEDVNGEWGAVGWILWSEGYVAIDVELPADGSYRFGVVAWGSESGDGLLPNMTLEIAGTDTSMTTRGSQAIKAQIQSLYKKMLGDDLLIDDPEINAVYDLLVETWEERKTHENNASAWHWENEDCLFPREIEDEEWNSLGQDPQQMMYSWASVIYYFMTHFDYLHE